MVGSGHLVAIISLHGYVWVVNREFDAVRSFKKLSNVLHFRNTIYRFIYIPNNVRHLMFYVRHTILRLHGVHCKIVRGTIIYIYSIKIFKPILYFIFENNVCIY